ncbi:MAG: hypothetical protein HC854_17090 [Flavobacterium sp.]|nr:hypothetical protein [Flavobacterium sp.]
MKHFINAAVICAVALTACNKPFKKMKDMPGGMEYKIISGNGKQVAYGNYVEIAVTQLTAILFCLMVVRTPLQ